MLRTTSRLFVLTSFLALFSSIASASESSICGSGTYWSNLHEEYGFPVVSFKQDIRWDKFKKDGYQILVTYEQTGEVEEYTIDSETDLADTFFHVRDVALYFPCLGSYTINMVMLANADRELSRREKFILKRAAAELKVAAYAGDFVKAGSALTGLSVWLTAAVVDKINGVLGNK